MKILELVIDEEAELFGIDALSIVEAPAIELGFLALKDEKVQFKEADKEKRILMGPALVPDKPIYRKNGEEEFYVYFSKSTIRRASELYLQHGNQANATLEHEHSINGLTMVESWIVEDKEKDKSALYGMDVPLGTWMVSVKVENEAIWQEWVKEGRVKGFSIEGFFSQKAQGKQDEMLSALAQAVALESFNDYPEAVSNNAKRGIELNEKQGNKCAQREGKLRAQQLANKENITLETIKRMASYLARAEEDFNENDTTACGTISYLLWGGKAGKRWADSKLKELLFEAIKKEIGG
jgi:hypothetical protein